MTLTRRQLLIAGVLLGSMVLALVADRVIPTDKKRVVRVVNAMCDAAEEADVEAMFAHVSRGYKDDVMSYALLRLLAESFFKRYGPVEVGWRRVGASVSGDMAVAELRVLARASGAGYQGLFGRSEWLIEFRKEAPGVWRVTRINPVRLGGRDTSTWQEVMRRGGL